MSIQTEITRLTQAKLDIKGALDRLAVSYEENKLDALALAVKNIPEASITQEGGTLKISAGYVSEALEYPVGSGDFSVGYLINNGDSSLSFQEITSVSGELQLTGDPQAVSNVSIPNTKPLIGLPAYECSGLSLVTGYIINNDDGSVYFQQVEASSGSVINTGDPITLSAVNIPETGVSDPLYGGSGGIDTSDAAIVTAEDVSEGLVFYNADGRQVGTLADATATIDGATVTVPAGRIRSEQTLTVPASSGATVSGNTVTVGKGYLADDISTSVASGSVTISGNTVIVTEGYVQSETKTVEAGSVVVDETQNKVIISEGYVQSGEIDIPSKADITLGQIDADGNFQPLSFVGTEASNSGDPETVDSYYGWNGTLPVPDEGINVNEAMDFYKCASVGPAKEIPDPLFRAQLTSQSSTAETGQAMTYEGNVTFQEIDGRYCAWFDGSSSISMPDTGLPTGAAPRTIALWTKSAGRSPSNSNYMIAYGTQSTGNYCGCNHRDFGSSVGGVTFAFWDTNVSTSEIDLSDAWHFVTCVLDGENQRIYVDGTLQASGASSVNTILSGTLLLGKRHDNDRYYQGYIADARIYDEALSEEQIKALYDPNPPPVKTWTGYKAVLTDGVYTFEETVTEGLSYGLIVPLIGNIYTDGALVNIKSLFMGMPTDYVFFDPLSDATGWTLSETGAEVVADDTRNVFRTSGDSSYFVLTTDPGVPLGSSPRTVSYWFRNINSNYSWCGIGYGASGTNHRFTWGLRDGNPGVTLWANDKWPQSSTSISDGNWHHVLITYNGNVITQYIDGQKTWDWSAGATNTTWQYIHVGDPWEQYACNGKFADLYIFDRVIEDHEIQLLYAARTV